MTSQKVEKQKHNKISQGLYYREKYRGLVGVRSKLPVKDSAALSSVYTPGVGEVCLEVQKTPELDHKLTCRGNTIGIISDGSAVFGLGNVGPEAALPALEVKSVFHKTLAGVDAYPMPVKTQDVNEIARVMKLIEPTFGAFHIEDIESPKCFELEEKLKETLSIPFLHVDKEGAAVSILAAIINASKLTEKKLKKLSVVIAGAGTAGISTAKLLVKAGIKNVILCDTKGAIYAGRKDNMNAIKAKIADITNKDKKKGNLEKVIKNADVLIGLSKSGEISKKMIKSMGKKPVILSLSVPEPEIKYNEAIKAGAYIVATGRSDSPNQLSSAIAAPGIFRAVLDVQAPKITDEMLIAAAKGMAQVIDEKDLTPENILPKVLDFRTAPAIAEAVAKEAIKSGQAIRDMSPEKIKQRTLEYIYEAENAFIEEPCEKELADDTSIGDKSILMHKRHNGVIEIKPKVPIKDHFIYDLLYGSPSAIEPCKIISKDKEKIYDYTCKNNMIAVLTDGTAVLGLGDIGATSGLPVMEGKCVLFKILGGVEGFPICVSSKEVEDIVWVTNQISTVFGGINLEDISAPRCFEIEENLKQISDIFIFHDDQHGTAVVTLAGIINALRITGKEKEHVKVVMNGAGAGAIAVAQLLLTYGIKNITICDSKGAIFKGRSYGMNPYKDKMAEITNHDCIEGSLADVIQGADVFIGLSVGNVLSQDMIRSMNPEPIIFALANPYPEIMPDKAYEAGAKIVATGRSDFPNQVNNSIAFPGIFRGSLDTQSKYVTNEMKVAAALALAELIRPEDLNQNNILPSGLDLRAPVAVSEAVAKCALEQKVARKTVDPAKVSKNLQEHLNEYTELRSV